LVIYFLHNLGSGVKANLNLIICLNCILSLFILSNSRKILPNFIFYIFLYLLQFWFRPMLIDSLMYCFPQFSCDFASRSSYLYCIVEIILNDFITTSICTVWFKINDQTFKQYENSVKIYCTKSRSCFSSKSVIFGS
jgi:hypothetical protein